MLVRDVMSQPVVSVEPQTPVRAAAAILTDRGFTALPVVDRDGELVGLVTEADLLRGRVHHDARSALLGEELDATPPPSTVGDVMAAEVFTTRPLADVADLVAQMRARGLRSVPVLGEDGRVEGIVSRRDVLQTMTRADAAIAADVRHCLETYAGPGRWTVDVEDGVVTLGDAFTDVVERHAARVIAASVRGVVDVRVASLQN